MVGGSWENEATVRELAIARMKDHGITPINWTTVAVELQRDWRLATGQDLGQVFHDSTMIGLWAEIRSGMLSFNSLRERNTDILYQRRALRRGPGQLCKRPIWSDHGRTLERGNSSRAGTRILRGSSRRCH
jgi:hypothetical protein